MIDLAVARRLDHDRLLGGAVGGQVIGAFERGGGVDGGLVGVELVAIRVGAGVDQDRVARLDARPSARRGVAGAAVIVVGAHDAGERRFGLRAGVADRIDVIDLAALRRPRLRTRAHGHRPGRIARPGRSRHPDRSARSAPRRRCRARGRGCCRRTCSARRDRTRSAARRVRPAGAAAACRSSTLSLALSEVEGRFAVRHSTLALRFASPSISHSKPRLISVGGSTINSPGVTRARRRAAPPAARRRCRSSGSRHTRWQSEAWRSWPLRGQAASG